MIEVWVCMRWKNEIEINGIFSTEGKAISRCKDKFDFIAPFNIDEALPEECASCTGQYYPLGETPEQGAVRVEAMQKEFDNKKQPNSKEAKE